MIIKANGKYMFSDENRKDCWHPVTGGYQPGEIDLVEILK